jgi:lipid-A-disaccharide synthase
MRRYVDHVLCTLPFERAWYKTRGIDSPYIGHPYFDALHQRQLDQGFLRDQRSRSGTVLGILPGSRRAELEFNFTTQLRAAELIHRAHPESRFLVACFKREHADRAASLLRNHYPAPNRSATGSLETGLRRDWSLPVELCVDRTAEVIHLAHSCLAVSGSVTLELLFERKPTVILYRTGVTGFVAYHLVRNVRYISLVNLLADRLLFPEYVTFRRPADRIAGHMLNWLNDPVEHERIRDELGALRDEVARPGACDRAASYILSQLRERKAAAA